MANKYYNDQTLSGYLVEGAKGNGYLKKSGKGYGDGATSNVNSNFNSGYETQKGDWFEGKKGSKGHSFPGEGRHGL